MSANCTDICEQVQNDKERDSEEQQKLDTFLSKQEKRVKAMLLLHLK